jgi:hypothetical protein
MFAPSKLAENLPADAAMALLSTNSTANGEVFLFMGLSARDQQPGLQALSWKV